MYIVPLTMPSLTTMAGQGHPGKFSMSLVLWILLKKSHWYRNKAGLLLTAVGKESCPAFFTRVVVE